MTLRLHEWHKRLKDDEGQERQGEGQADLPTGEPRPGEAPVGSPADRPLLTRPGTRVRGPARLPDVRPPKPVEVPRKHLPSIGAPSRSASPPATSPEGARQRPSEPRVVAEPSTAPAPPARPASRPASASRGAAAGRLERGRALAIEQALARIRGTKPAPVPEAPFAEEEVDEGAKMAEPLGDIERRAVRIGERARDVLSAWRTRQGALPLDIEEPGPKRGRPRTVTESRETLIEKLLDPELTLNETATLLSVCPSTVRRYTDKGILGHHRTPGNQRRFRLSEVLEFMERQHRGAG